MKTRIQDLLYASIGWVLDFARSETELHNAERLYSSGTINPSAKSSNGGPVVDCTDALHGPLEEWKGGGFEDLEPQGVSIASSAGLMPQTWRTTNRLQPKDWYSMVKPIIREEMYRLGSMLGDFDFVSVAFGMNWTEVPGLSQRRWLTESIAKLERYNASPKASKYGVFIMLRACHINVKAGEGPVRPMRPHWHLVLAVRRHRGGKGQWMRLRAAMAYMRELVGAVVTQKGDFARNQIALKKILVYLLHYPVQLVDSEKNDLGSHGKILLTDEKKGLRLQPFPAPASKLKQATTPVLPGLPPKWEGLTDPYAFLDPFKALAGLVILQRYYLPGESKNKKLTPKAKAKQQRKKALRAIRNKLQVSWPKMWPWVQCVILEFWLIQIQSELPPPPDLTAKNKVIRSYFVVNRKTGKRTLRARVRNVTTLEELKTANPNLAAEWDREKSVTPPPSP